MGTCEEPGLREQVLYYRRRAPEYDETSVGSKAHDAERFRRWLERLEASGDALEIACGTGLWTQHLVRRVTSLTALDSSPEVIELARQRVAGSEIRFVVADFFSWRPERRYDCAFFGFWLSHVPPERFADFWRRLATCLEPDGRALFVDEGVDRAPRDANPGEPFVERRLRDGSTYRIVKVFHEPDGLGRALADVGWTAQVEPLEDGFLAGVARPAGSGAR